MAGIDCSEEVAAMLVAQRQGVKTGYTTHLLDRDVFLSEKRHMSRQLKEVLNSSEKSDSDIQKEHDILLHMYEPMMAATRWANSEITLRCNSCLSTLNKIAEGCLMGMLVATRFDPEISPLEFIKVRIYPESYDVLYFEVYDNRREYTQIASFRLMEMPGCCGMLISYNAYVDSHYSKQGIGTILNRYRSSLAKRMGYSVLISTDRDNNTVQKKILLNNNWKRAFWFKNRRTGNIINMHYKVVWTVKKSKLKPLRFLQKLLSPKIPDAEKDVYNKFYKLYPHQFRYGL